MKLTRNRFFFYLKRPSKLVKRLLPKSFWGRSLLIVITPVFLIQVISGYVFFERHWEQTTRLLANGIANEIALGVSLVEKYPEEQQLMLSLITKSTQLEVEILPQGSLPHYRSRFFQSRFERALRYRLPYPHRIRITSSKVFVWIQGASGVFCFSFLKKRLFSHTTPLWFFWSLGASFFFAFLASVFMRRQIRPLQELALVAEGLSDGKNLHTYQIRGATEIRHLGQTFFLMQRRLLEKIEEQSMFLAGISHDVRTPLTRIRLQLELMTPSPDVDELKTDVNHLIRLVEEYLEFIRQEERETPQKVHLYSFCRMLLKSFQPFSHEVEMEIPQDISLEIRARSLRRCLQNLLQNAFRYAKNKVSLKACRTVEGIQIIVDDDGIGIDPRFYKLVLKPFFRVAQDRNPETGGTGLGLAIVHQLIAQEKGEILLDVSPLGGLRVILKIPQLTAKGFDIC